jgi:hypothetical protein
MGNLSWFLSFCLSLTPITIESIGSDCFHNPELMGQYEAKTETITLCENNITLSKYSKEEIVKHELIHYIYHKHQIESIIPEPLITWLVRKNIPSDQVMYVILNEDKYSLNEEFSARLLQKLPSWIIGIGIIL